MNIVIVVIDALRARNLGCYGYGKKTSPNIDSVAEEGIKFDKCFSCANCTDSSLTTILSGKHPLNHGVIAHGSSNWEENSRRFRETGTNLLQKILSENGYESRLFDIGINGPWLRNGWTETQEKRPLLARMRTKIGNFAKNLSPSLWDFSKKAYRSIFGMPDPRIPAEELTDRALSGLRAAEEPFFALIHYWDVHIPYTPPEEHRKIFRGEYDDGERKVSDIMDDLEEKGKTFGQYFEHVARSRDRLSDIWADYDGCIHYVDKQIRRLYEGLSDDTLFVITADHGENVGKDKPIYFSHAYLYDTVTHVPLILTHPSLKPREDEGLTSHVDIVPTLLDLLDMKKPSFVDGVNMLDSDRDAVYAEMGKSRARMVRADKWKYLYPLKVDDLKERYWYNGNGQIELYDLQNDPNERKNLAEVHSDKAEELHNRLSKRIQEFRTKREKSRIKRKIRGD